MKAVRTECLSSPVRVVAQLPMGAGRAARGLAAVVLSLGVCAAALGCLGRSETGLGSRDPAERVRAMAEAAAASDDGAVPGLIERLSSEDAGERLLAIRALERITGDTRGFDHAGPAREREAAIGRWVRWWAESRQEGSR